MGTSLKSRSLADALFTTTQQRLLGLLFGRPGESFFVRELIERTGSGSGAVQRELVRLVEGGLVRAVPLGKRKRYEANRDSPIFQELRSLVTKTTGLADPLKRALHPLRDRTILALVYGSMAKGEARADSDVDLLVVAHDLTLEELFRRLAPAEKVLGRKINPTLYTPEEFERRERSGNAFLKKVLAGAHILLMGAESGPAEAR